MSSSPAPKPAGSVAERGTRRDLPLKLIAERIKSNKAKNIVVLTGAGISTSAGIPDFRSPETGLYANLERLNLPFPEAVFELGYFKKNPVPFWTLAKDLYPGKYLPTPTHYFLTLLHRRSVLLRTFTQNIDTLETLASLPPEKIIEAHGSFASAHCLSCEKEVSREYVLEAGVRDGKVVKCDEEGCRGLVKPDIVFFGEGLPERFFEHMGDLKKADLVIVIGTSLQVQPFASLAQYCRPGTPRLLINREAVGPFAPPRRKTGKESLGTLLSQLGISESDVPELESSDDEAAGGYDYSFWKGDSDEGIRRLAKELGWEEELDEMIKEGHEALRAKWREADPVGQIEDGRGENRDFAAEAEKLAKDVEASSEQRDDVDPELDKANGRSSDEDDEDDSKVPDDEIKDMGRMLAEYMKKGAEARGRE